MTTPSTAYRNFASSMAFKTPSVRVVTDVEATPVRDEPAATSVATRIVESANAGGIMTALASWVRMEAERHGRQGKASFGQSLPQTYLRPGEPAG